ncbi:MAG: hypothetical protein ABI723_19725 [Bacteroidia bacterium]
MKNYQNVLRIIGGYSLMTAGLISAVALCFHPDEFIPGSVLLNSWRPVHLSLLFAFTISIFGVVGLFSTLNGKPDALGVIAFGLGVIGCAYSAAVVVLEVFVLPSLASQADTQVPLMEMMSSTTPFHALGVFFMSAVMVWIFAWVLIGVVLLRSNLFKPYIGILIIAASIAIAIPTHFAGGLSGILHIVVSLLFGASWLILGNALVKHQPAG